MKLVIYNKENSQPVGQRNGEMTLRFNRENGMIYISKSFAAELGIKDIDKVQFANDEENTKDWFICKTDSEQGFSIKYDKGGIRFMNKFLSNKILDCAKVKDNASFLMEKEPITVDGTKYFKIMLSSPGLTPCLFPKSVRLPGLWSMSSVLSRRSPLVGVSCTGKQ